MELLIYKPFESPVFHVKHIALANDDFEVLDFLGIEELESERAGNLSGGQKKLLELGRTMMVDANRLVELTSHMIKMGVTSWSDYLTKKK